MRGPAALLYGGTAVGGVVNIIDNRIPRDAVSGFGGTVEGRFGGAEKERGYSTLLEGGNGQFAIHADGKIHKNDVYRWEHEDDARSWFAPHLEQFLEKRLKSEDD